MKSGLSIARSLAVVQLSFYCAVVEVLGVNECRFNSECSGTEECTCKQYTNHRRGRTGATYREVAYTYCCSPTYYYGLGGTAAIIVIIAIIGIAIGCYCYKKNCGKRGRVVPLATNGNSTDALQLQLQPNSDNIVHVPPENKVSTSAMVAAPGSTAVPYSPSFPYAAFPAMSTGTPADYRQVGSLPT